MDESTIVNIEPTLLMQMYSMYIFHMHTQVLLDVVGISIWQGCLYTVHGNFVVCNLAVLQLKAVMLLKTMHTEYDNRLCGTVLWNGTAPCSVHQWHTVCVIT